MTTLTHAVVPYAVVVHTEDLADPGWKQVVETLEKNHPGAARVEFAGDWDKLRAELAARMPARTAFVLPYRRAGRQAVAAIHRLTRALDADPYADTLWGIVTGLDASDALAACLTKPLVIRKAAAGTEIDLSLVEQGRWFCELKAGKRVHREPGGASMVDSGPTDSTAAIVDSLNTYAPDLFITSGHASERNWTLGYTYSNGLFKSKAGRLFGEDTHKATFDVQSNNPKVYLAVGNCLMGHIDGPDAMALAWMHSAGVRQMVGYTVESWYGYAGWGMLDYFFEQPGRYDLASAFLANQHALIHRLETEYGGSAKPGKGASQDEQGLRYDRDVLACYGDPGWDARLAPGPLRWKQSLTEKDGLWTFQVEGLAGDKTFTPVNMNGSQRGHRPLIEFFQRPLGPVEIVSGQEFKPVVTDDFLLLPNPGKLPAAGSIKISFRETGKP
jgi:zinc protease